MTAQITKGLRGYIDAVRAYHLTDIHGKRREYVDTTTRDLLEIADRIDAEHEQCKDENHKLRRLVRDMWMCMREGEWDCSDCPRYARCDDGISEFRDRARELGLEVDE